jgi:cyclic beta-1,2-glucan synthetase
MDYIHVAAYFILIGAALYIAIYNRNKKLENIEVHDTILGIEEAQKHAAEIGSRHVIKKSGRFSRLFISRVNKNYKYIQETHLKLSGNLKNKYSSIPAAEWLLDNYYIIEEQMSDIRRNLTSRAYEKLPILKNGYLRGLPRIYAIALELVVHSDGNIDEKTIVVFIKAYQTQSLLSVGELWFLASMLRIALIDALRNICSHIMETHEEHLKAEELIKSIEQSSSQSDEQCIKVLNEYLKKTETLKPSFVEHFLHKLRRKLKVRPKIIKLLNEKLQNVNLSVDEITAFEHQNQASLQVSIGNTITSLKAISNMDWTEIFESLSQVEDILNLDPSGIYSKMDFESRDYYRNIVEKLAAKYNTSETLVARKLVECACEADDSQDFGSPTNHIGFYLMDKGRATLEKKVGYRLGTIDVIAGSIKKHSVAAYIGAIAILTFLIIVFFIEYSIKSSVGFSLFMQILTAIVVLIPASDLAIFFVNFISKICSLINYHDRYIEPSFNEVRKAISTLGEDTFCELVKVKEADIKAQNPQFLEKRLLQLQEINNIYMQIKEQDQCLSLKDMAINGKHLLSLGFKEGKEVGKILNNLLELVIENPELNYQEKLIEIVYQKFINN